MNPGNSGGPLLDSSGRLIGVKTAIISESGSSAGIGFAIPVDLVNRVVPEIIKHGRAPRPGIGIVAADERVAAQLGIRGVVVLGVRRGSPADEAGMRPFDARSREPGDVIVSADGKPTMTLADLAAVLEAAGVGKQRDAETQAWRRRAGSQTARDRSRGVTDALACSRFRPASRFNSNRTPVLPSRAGSAPPANRAPPRHSRPPLDPPPQRTTMVPIMPASKWPGMRQP